MINPSTNSCSFEQLFHVLPQPVISAMDPIIAQHGTAIVSGNSQEIKRILTSPQLKKALPARWGRALLFVTIGIALGSTIGIYCYKKHQDRKNKE